MEYIHFCVYDLIEQFYFALWNLYAIIDSFPFPASTAPYYLSLAETETWLFSAKDKYRNSESSSYSEVTVEAI